MSPDRLQIAGIIGRLLDGTLTGDAAIDYLTHLDITRVTPQQLAGAVDAVMAHAVPFEKRPNALDCCGTGGDGRATYNISTAAALVVAARGVLIAKHGNRAVTSQCGSADVLEALGVHTHSTPEHVLRMLDDIGITFLYAPSFHPGFAKVAPFRKAIPTRTIFNLIGPLCNPAGVKRQLIGVFAAEYCTIVAEAAQLLGRENVMVVHGEDGTDEISITGKTHVAHLQNGEIHYYSIRPQDVGLSTHDGRTLIGGNATQNARALKDVLGGLDSPYADAVLLNAAALLMIAGKAPTLSDGVALARSAIGRGEALAKLEELVEASFPDE